MSRIANGLPLPQSEVVAADALALLSGVSFGSTIKVMLALNLIHTATGHSFDQLLAVESLPTAPPVSEDRFDSTRDFVHTVIDHPAARAASATLKLARFNS
ncbi:MAG: hypothetical protein RSE62_03425 [Citrobacter sp.]